MQQHTNYSILLLQYQTCAILTCCEQVNGPGGATSTHAKEDVPEVGLLGELGLVTVGATGLECDAMPVVVVPGVVAVVAVVGVAPGGVVAVKLVGVALGGAVTVGVMDGAPGDVTDTAGGLEVVLTGEDRAVVAVPGASIPGAEGAAGRGVGLLCKGLGRVKVVGERPGAEMGVLEDGIGLGDG